MAISKITTRGMSGDTLEAGDIAPNAIGASELADNAVDTAAIAATSITEAKLNADVTDGSAITTAVKPHIQPGLLYPSWQGYLSDISPAHKFTDSGATGHKVNGIGSGVSHSTQQKKIGNTSIEFKDYWSGLQVADHADWDFGTGGDFTVEGWVYYVNSGAEDAANNYDNILVQTGAFQLARQQSSNKLYSFTGSNSGAESSGTLTNGSWHHIAICRHSGTIYGYVGGVKKFQYSDTTDIDYSGNITIGNGTGSSTHWFLDQFRLSNNARYPSGTTFTPSTTAYSSDANTKLLIQSNVASSVLHSGAYGTTQSDGKKYYYTDIKGSLPIKDPRIGAHFGGQRHKTTSMQLLEQETGMHGEKVYSVDGRRWLRLVDGADPQNTGNTATFGGGAKWGTRYNSNGTHVRNESSDSEGLWFEVVGYFNDFNVLMDYGTGRVTNADIYVNGALSQAGNSTIFGESARDTPLNGRYVSGAGVVHGGSTLSASLGTTPAINTLKVLCTNAGADYVFMHGIELIAQDTTSTANRSKIQIPAQNVVSYGKKFSVSAAAHHYDPFNGFTNGTSLHSQFVDTATSLGLDSAPGSSASWAISNTNNIRPYNGGRVVKWIASDGTIKTSVTMMPPNAQNIKTAASNEITTPSATNTTTTPNMSGDAINHSLSEVAKTFHWREFGNGKANGSSNSVYRDASMLSTSTDDFVFVMDDGLTSLMGNDVNYEAGHLMTEATDDFWGATFIGTGVTISTIGGNTYAEGTHHIANNLPYGTHLLKTTRTSSAGSQAPTMHLDGLTYTHGSTHVARTYGGMYEITYHQPKMPPIPEDACIIADYMLMADFVRQSAPTASSAPWDPDHTLISKGVRMCSPSRDIFFNETTGGYVFSFDAINTGPGGFYNASSATSSGGQNNYVQLPAFGTDFLLANSRGGGIDLYVNGTDVAHTTTSATGGHTFQDFSYPDSPTTLGLNIFKGQGLASDYSPYINPKGFMIVTPIHTSSHYQTFETPYLHELVGGDRNMEQTNLVVTADGKSWDEVTRDTSYLGNRCVMTTTDTAESTGAPSGKVEMDEWRGTGQGKNYHNKDFAIAYDGIICLKEGWYTSHAQNIAVSSYSATSSLTLLINSAETAYAHHSAGADHLSYGHTHTFYAKRGDFIQISGIWHSTKDYGYWQITKAEK